MDQEALQRLVTQRQLLQPHPARWRLVAGALLALLAVTAALAWR